MVPPISFFVFGSFLTIGMAILGRLMLQCHLWSPKKMKFFPFVKKLGSTSLYDAMNAVQNLIQVL